MAEFRPLALCGKSLIYVNDGLYWSIVPKPFYTSDFHQPLEKNVHPTVPSWRCEWQENVLICSIKMLNPCEFALRQPIGLDVSPVKSQARSSLRELRFPKIF